MHLDAFDAEINSHPREISERESKSCEVKARKVARIICWFLNNNTIVVIAVMIRLFLSIFHFTAIVIVLL